MSIILASASERRKELLKRIIPDFKVIASDFNEDSVTFNGDCIKYVENLSLGKAQDVASKTDAANIIIGCDTIVYHNKKVLGKPKNEEEAYKMLTSLSGNSHYVYSGISIINTKTNNIVQDCVCTEVYFSKLSESQIQGYIKSGEPMDKAGSYGIQGYGGIFVEKINGCYYNVVGLPINKLYSLLGDMGVNL
ncbi:Maf-like protein [Candidatus Clostridium stratigraminis]|uniref:dTTP/UTP pyrophosphatase n=1 Tax=Candidatus Clostridium stratigraminis TaxID=3381661 RepID=A0ABW8T4Y7_9CLOT